MLTSPVFAQSFQSHSKLKRLAESVNAQNKLIAVYSDKAHKNPLHPKAALYEKAIGVYSLSSLAQKELQRPIAHYKEKTPLFEQAFYRPKNKNSKNSGRFLASKSEPKNLPELRNLDVKSGQSEEKEYAFSDPLSSLTRRRSYQSYLPASNVEEETGVIAFNGPLNGLDYQESALNETGDESIGSKSNQDEGTISVYQGVENSNDLTTITSSNNTSSNNPPLAVEDQFSTNKNVGITLNIANQILANDSDPEGKTLEIKSFDFDSDAIPAGSIINNGDGTITYTPGLNYVGVDSFNYEITDGELTSVGTISIIVSDPTLLPNFEQEEKGSAQSLNSVTTSAPLLAFNDQLYLAFVSYTDDTNAVNSLSGLGLTWTKLTQQCSNQGDNKVEVWYAQGLVGTSSVVQATLNTNAISSHILVMRYSNVNTSTPIGNVGSANPLGEGVLASCGNPGTASKDINYSLATNNANSLITSVNSFMKTGTFSAISGSKLDEITIGANPNILNMAVQNMSAGVLGSYPIIGNISVAAKWSSISIEINSP